jgi:HAD superfamily hydrolase (TIGR01509 family)
MAQVVPVFDLGEVLVFVHEEWFLEKLEGACREGARAQDAFFRHFDRLGINRGGDFAGLHPLLVEEIGLRMRPEEFRLAWQDIFTANQPMIEFVAALPRPRYLLSNTSEPHVAWLRERYPQSLDVFDHCVLSYEVGAEKPDLAIYRMVESVSGQPPESHVFFDDRPDNVEGARAAGWQAYQFVGVEECRERLRGRGLGVP